MAVLSPWSFSARMERGRCPAGDRFETTAGAAIVSLMLKHYWKSLFHLLIREALFMLTMGCAGDKLIALFLLLRLIASGGFHVG